MFRITRLGLATVALLLPARVAFAIVIPQETRTESRVASISDGTTASGEIQYDFDSAVNRTHVRFVTSLVRGRGLLRIFSSKPPVHTLVAAYEFLGRGAPSATEFVEVSLVSDEYTAMPLSDRPLVGRDHALTFTIDNTVYQYALGIAQRIEMWESLNLVSPVTRSVAAGEVSMNLPRRPIEAHIERTATARIPVCAFLRMITVPSVQGTVAGLDFELDGRAVFGLRQFAEKLSASGGSCR